MEEKRGKMKKIIGLRYPDAVSSIIDLQKLLDILLRSLSDALHINRGG
jgi:hypothetical protein